MMLYRTIPRFNLTMGLTPNSLSRLAAAFYSTQPVASAALKRTQSYVHGISNAPLLDKTLGQLVDEQAEKRPDKEVFVLPFQNIRKTFSQFKQDVDAFGAGLLALGLQRGDRVGMWGPNSYEWLITQFATAKAGLILVNVNPGYKAHELEYCLKKVEIKALVSGSESTYVDTLRSISPDLLNLKNKGKKTVVSRVPNLEHIILVPNAASDSKLGVYQFAEISESGTKDSKSQLEDINREVQFDDPVNIQFTSGTTGNPKGATLTHHNIVNNAYFGGKRLGYADQETRLCSPVPLYHCFGCVLGTLTALVHGSCTVVPAERFDPEATLKAIDAEKCTVIYGVPTMYIDQINHANFSQYNTKTLRAGFMSGAPCPVELVRQAKAKMGMKDIIVGYGMTETSPLTLISYLGDSEARCAQTIGTALDHMEIRIADSDGRVVPIGSKGEIQTRGFANMKGYWEDEVKTNEFYTPTKWGRTGDLGMMDEDGYVKIVGRSKDCIIRGGENVYPAEVENCLHEHPAVAEAHVIGVPDPRLGEEICCWIKLRNGVPEAELKEFCRTNLARFKVPKYFVYVDKSQSFPLTVTGKVQKFKMREQSLKLLKLENVAKESFEFKE